MGEIFEIVNDDDEIIGTATREECHSNPNLIHRTAHVIVFSSDFKILLQKRSLSKDVQPGKWDTAVGGHFSIGESAIEAAKREMNEEIGIPASQKIKFLFKMKIRNSIESENISVFFTIYDGPFAVQKEEIDEIRFWNKNELKELLNSNEITPNCIEELNYILRTDITKLS